jgi:PAS domain-containing protein
MQENSYAPIDFYLELVNNMPHSVVVTDRDRKIIFCNKVLEPTFGEKVQSILRDTWQDSFDIFTVDRVKKYNTETLPIARAIRGETLVGEKMYITGKQCSGIYIKMCSYPIVHKGDQITVIIFENITEEQKIFDAAIDKLLELERYLKQHSIIKKQTT